MSFQFVNITKKIENLMGSVKATQIALLSYYKPIIKNEIKLANATEKSNILFIGGGYFPCTAILFQNLTGAKVTVIDIDKDAINSSKKRLEKLDLDDKVNIVLANGKDIDASEYDIVHVAMQVSPKDTVFEQIKNSIKTGSKILVRIPKNAIAKGYYNFDIETEKSIKQPKYSNIGSTYLYVK